MSQNLEIEFKNMLTKEEFETLKANFQIDSSQFKTQTNHYFDTPSFGLKEQGSALRIREKGNHFEMTLKQPVEKGLLETNQSLSKQEAQVMIQSGKIKDGPVLDEIRKIIQNPEALQFFGSLITERTERDYLEGLLVLDHSSYLNCEDYEIEYEVTDEKKGYEIFTALLHELHIPIRSTDNKIKRFYDKKYESLPKK